jgi:hypothetical protein
VYSFAVLMSELVNKCASHVGCLDNDLRQQRQLSLENIELGARPYFDASKCPPQFAALIRRCWATQPGDRPTMTEVVRALQQIEASLAADGRDAGFGAESDA